MDEKETSEYLGLLDEALELMSEKRYCMTQVLQGSVRKEKRAYLKRVEELDVLLAENSQYLQTFDHLRK